MTKKKKNQSKKFSLDANFLEEKKKKKAQVENGILRFISLFNVSIQNKDDKGEGKKKKSQKRVGTFSCPHFLMLF